MNEKMGCLSTTMVAVARVLLMAICIIMFIFGVFSFVALVFLTNAVTDQWMPTVGFRLFALSVYVLIATAVCLLGISATYNKNPRHLKIFAICFALSAVLDVVTYDYSIKDQWANNRGHFLKTMTDLAADYQMDLAPGQLRNSATEGWDILQTGLQCCGLDGPKDWSASFHKTIKSIVPASCCLILPRSLSRNSLAEQPGGNACKLADAFEVGCTKRLDDFVANRFSRVIMGAILDLLIALLALIVAKGFEMQGAQLASSPNAPTTHYQRFVGVANNGRAAVQVDYYSKQPAVAPGYGDAPSIYANPYAVEHSPANGPGPAATSSPPPEYKA